MQGKKILVVDDDPDIVEYLSTLLEDHGYEVQGASGASAARTTLEQFAADLLILDVLLAGRSGLDLLVNLRQDARWRDLPIVMLTGSDQVLRDGGRSYMAGHTLVRGADAVLGKPLEAEVLLDAISRLGR